MPWHAEYYPPAMRHLPAAVRNKAIAIANALLEQGYDEGKAIRIAVAKAKKWESAHLARNIGATFTRNDDGAL